MVALESRLEQFLLMNKHEYHTKWLEIRINNVRFEAQKRNEQRRFKAHRNFAAIETDIYMTEAISQTNKQKLKTKISGQVYFVLSAMS